MPYRFTPLVNGEYYHVYNRGVASQSIFYSKRDYERFIKCLSYYRFKDFPFKLSRLLQLQKDEKEKYLQNLNKMGTPAVKLISYCLMPNHFHILVQQQVENGISRFLKLISDSYTRYFNTKNDRVGPIFQGAFKAVHITTNEQLLHVSRYIHLNPLVAYLIKEEDFVNYPWFSLKAFLSENASIIDSSIVLSQFKNPHDYLQFILDHADYAKELEKIKHLTFE